MAQPVVGKTAVSAVDIAVVSFALGGAMRYDSASTDQLPLLVVGWYADGGLSPDFQQYDGRWWQPFSKNRCSSSGAAIRF